MQKEALDVPALNTARQHSEKVDARNSRVVELCYFGGLSADEVEIGSGSTVPL